MKASKVVINACGYSFIKSRRMRGEDMHSPDGRRRESQGIGQRAVDWVKTFQFRPCAATGAYKIRPSVRILTRTEMHVPSKRSCACKTRSTRATLPQNARKHRLRSKLRSASGSMTRGTTLPCVPREKKRGSRNTITNAWKLHVAFACMLLRHVVSADGRAASLAPLSEQR